MKEAYPRLQSRNVAVVGINADSLESHRRFAESLDGLPFPMLSDADRATISAYGVLNERGTGPRRSVFVVGRDGLISYVNDHYDVGNPAHLEALLKAAGVAGEGRVAGEH